MLFANRPHTHAADKDKFGQKMLEKMGWTEGSGLGAKGNGTTSHVKVRRKNDALGVGASNKVGYFATQLNQMSLVHVWAQSHRWRLWGVTDTHAQNVSVHCHALCFH